MEDFSIPVLASLVYYDDCEINPHRFCQWFERDFRRRLIAFTQTIFLESIPARDLGYMSWILNKIGVLKCSGKI